MFNREGTTRQPSAEGVNGGTKKDESIINRQEVEGGLFGKMMKNPRNLLNKFFLGLLGALGVLVVR